MLPLNTTSAALDPKTIEGLSLKPLALSLGDPLVVDETKESLRSMANCKAMGTDELPVELFESGLSDSSYEIFVAFHGIIVTVWMKGRYRRSEKTSPPKFCTRRKSN